MERRTQQRGRVFFEFKVWNEGLVRIDWIDNHRSPEKSLTVTQTTDRGYK